VSSTAKDEPTIAMPAAAPATCSHVGTATSLPVIVVAVIVVADDKLHLVRRTGPLWV
jgi:hypothetical protein